MESAPDENNLPPDSTDDFNKDPEDDLKVTKFYGAKPIKISKKMMAERKVLDTRRWFCIARNQHLRSCGISSLVSCWNYLYSTLGTGDLPPISVEAAMHFLGFRPPYEEIRFGGFTGNDTLIHWFHLLNLKYGVTGEADIQFKFRGKQSTFVDKR